MYEDQTYEVIMARMKAEVLRLYPGIDTREGSVIHVALGPVCAELAQAYISMDAVINETYADKASMVGLTKRMAERGMKPYDAKKAIRKGEFTPSSLELAISGRFTLNGLNYAITEKVSAGIYKMECETAGVVGNYDVGDLVPVNYIPGLETCKLTDVLIPGENAELLEVARARYFADFETAAYGGNFNDYRQKTNELQGVGGVKVYRAWNGGGTVKLVIINSDFAKPSTELVSAIQTAIDPVVNAGEGVGIAPIGHIVTIEGVSEIAINITATITYQSGWDFAAAKAAIETAIDNYLHELSQTWESSQTLTTDSGLVVRISQIETRLLDVAGIVDIEGTTINGVAGNLTTTVTQIPKRGTFNGS